MNPQYRVSKRVICSPRRIDKAASQIAPQKPLSTMVIYSSRRGGKASSQIAHLERFFYGFLNGGMDYWDWIVEYNGQPQKSDGRYLTDVFTEEAVQFIQRHKTKPFFLYVAYNAPHSPLQAPQEVIHPYLETGKFNPAVCTLYGMIQQMDAGIGHILDTLEQHGLADNKIVLFTSDNGPWLGNDKLDGEIYSMKRFMDLFVE